jgi:exodeoxyribonuclease-5
LLLFPSLISAIVKALGSLNQKALLLAPTGRAAKVFSGYMGKSAFTIHRKIYRQKSTTDGSGNFILNKNLFSSLIIIVDKASMISNTAPESSSFGSGSLLADLISFVNDGNNRRLILVGDTAQLPPVGIILSPALNKYELSLCMPVAGDFTLTDDVRQYKQSGILQNATIIHNQLASLHLIDYDVDFEVSGISITGKQEEQTTQKSHISANTCR